MRSLYIRFVSIFLLVLAFGSTGLAQDMSKFKLYKPDENAEQGLKAAIAKAKASGKHVFVQIGGNWCVWCARFNEFTTTDKKIDSLINNGYVVYHLNYSKENENLPILKKYEYPQRFGFPVFLILDGTGKKIHTQNSAYLEEGKGYSKDKVVEFFEGWSPKALDPSNYIK